MPNRSEWKDDGRRCHECNGNSSAKPLQRYTLAESKEGPLPELKTVYFHDTCVGVHLMKHHSAAVRFQPGETK